MDLEKYNTVFKYIVNKIKNYDTSDVPLDIGIEYYTFEEHFFKYLGVNQYSELSNYGPQALEYIDKTFPYCFMKIDNKNVDEAIKSYVLSQGGTIEDVPKIIELLKNTQMKHISKYEIREKINNQEMSNEEECTTINNITGTSVSKYQLSNLYDILTTINDKNINSYISYIVVNNIFNNKKHFQRVFNGISITKDEEGNSYVNEGNHRIFTYLALLKIREYLNIPTESKNYTVNAMLSKPIELNHNITK